MKKMIALGLALVLVLLLVGCGRQTADAVQNKWGVTLKAEKVTATGLTIVCRQSGGENAAQLQTGSFYALQKQGESGWEDVSPELDVMWTMEAWVIPAGTSVSWDVNWEGLYGKLPAGEYRIGKEIMNFRGPGDYDEEMVYAEFTIK